MSITITIVHTDHLRHCHARARSQYQRTKPASEHASAGVQEARIYERLLHRLWITDYGHQSFNNCQSLIIDLTTNLLRPEDQQRTYLRCRRLAAKLSTPVNPVHLRQRESKTSEPTWTWSDIWERYHGFLGWSRWELFIPRYIRAAGWEQFARKALRCKIWIKKKDHALPV